MSDKTDVTIVGAGVIGLAIATEVARKNRAVYVLEKNETFGQETSSRHSGVIHSGVYYLPGSLKDRLCVRGRHLLYDLGAKYSIGHKRIGKLIVATDKSEVEQLYTLMARGKENELSVWHLVIGVQTAITRRRQLLAVSCFNIENLFPVGDCRLDF